MTLVQEYQTDTITVLRSKTGGSYSDVDGKFTQGQKENISMIAVVEAIVQGTLSKELLNRMQAQRSTKAIQIFTDEELVIVNEYENKVADCVEYRGCNWQVQTSEDWTKTDHPHWKSLAFKVEKDAEERTPLNVI